MNVKRLKIFGNLSQENKIKAFCCLKKNKALVSTGKLQQLSNLKVMPRMPILQKVIRLFVW